MTRNIKHYRVGMDSETLAISLVDEGAIEMDFIALAKQQEPVEIKMANEEKHIVIGCVLCPDKPIYRNQDGEEFYITFDKDVIRKMAFDYLANDRQHNVTLQHQKETKGAVMVESWIKEGDNDKSDYYGLQAPVGSWLCTMKINDNKIWQGIKNGEFNGFSIESLVQVEDIDLSKVKNNNINKNTKMAKENINMEQVEVNDSFWDKLLTSPSLFSFSSKSLLFFSHVFIFSKFFLSLLFLLDSSSIKTIFWGKSYLFLIFNLS